uniref:Uncharacterized protein n=1 Tax=Oryza brachyantha TaxID=4533 RepID=J3LTJ1_ORYBR
MPKAGLEFVIPNTGCGVEEFMLVLAEVNEKTGACDEKAGDDCAPNEKPPPEEADWPNVNMLGGDELEPNGLLKAGDDEVVELLLNILVLAIVKDDPADVLGDENANPLPELEKVVPDPKGELPNKDPDEEVVTPNDTVPGPDEEVPTPKDTVPGADEEVPAPKDTVPDPDEEVPAPKGTVPGADEEFPAPKDTVPGPDEVPANPKDTVLGPDEEVPVPKDMAAEPAEVVPTPKDTDPKPDEEAPVLENAEGVVDAFVEAIPSFEAANVEDENVAVLEKAEEDATGELATFEEIGAALRFSDALLAVSCAVDLTSAIAPPVPNKVLAGFASVFVPSDLVVATIEVLEPKLNVGIVGLDDEKGVLLLDTANVVGIVDAAKLTAGLSPGVPLDNFGDDASEKPLLRLAVVDVVEAKWKGAAKGNTLSDDLWTYSAFSFSLPLSTLVLSNVVGLVTLETQSRTNKQINHG